MIDKKKLFLQWFDILSCAQNSDWLWQTETFLPFEILSYDWFRLKEHSKSFKKLKQKRLHWFFSVLTLNEEVRLFFCARGFGQLGHGFSCFPSCARSHVTSGTCLSPLLLPRVHNRGFQDELFPMDLACWPTWKCRL